MAAATSTFISFTSGLTFQPRPWEGHRQGDNDAEAPQGRILRALHARFGVRRRRGSGSGPGWPGRRPARAPAPPEGREACSADPGPPPPARLV
jgi:hypothetical protein